MKFVLLQNIEFPYGKFFTTHREGIDPDPTKLYDGTVAYEIIGYADTVDDAQQKLYGRTFPHLPPPVTGRR